AGAALPDEDLDGVAAEDLDELDVGAVGKRWMSLDERTHAPTLALVEVLLKDHAVRIAHRDGGHRERDAVRELQGTRHHLTVGTIQGNPGGAEGRLAHLDGAQPHAAVAHVALAFDPPAPGVDGEGPRRAVTVIPQVLGEDA